MKKNKFSKNWVFKQKRDLYVKQSKIQGYRSRAVYKLQEINERFKVIKNGIYIVDLGAAPGSWSQFVSQNFKNSKISEKDRHALEGLGLKYEAKWADIQKKFKGLVKKYHPDKNRGSKKYEDILKKITLAYSQLKNTVSREK